MERLLPMEFSNLLSREPSKCDLFPFNQNFAIFSSISYCLPRLFFYLRNVLVPLLNFLVGLSTVRLTNKTYPFILLTDNYYTKEPNKNDQYQVQAQLILNESKIFTFPADQHQISAFKFFQSSA